VRVAGCRKLQKWLFSSMKTLGPRRLLVTGCTGFLGSHLLLELLKADRHCEIHCLVRPGAAADSLAPEARLLRHLHTALCDSG